MNHFGSKSVGSAGLVGWAICVILGQAIAEPSAAETRNAICPVARPPLKLPARSSQSTLSADRAQLIGTIATARGNALLESNGQALEAPYLRYNRKTAETKAHGGLKYLRDGLYVTADKGNYNIAQHTGAFENVHYSMLTRGARGRADQAHSLNAHQYRFKNAAYSTCPGPVKAWLLSAQHLELNQKTGRGVAHNATLKIHGIPVLYTPYINFPIDDKRHTGFLMPTLGYSSNSGFELSAPYYINIAPNYDATLVPRYMARRGFQLGGQFRYKFRHHQGNLEAQTLPHDSQYGAERDLEHFYHISQLTPHIGFTAHYARVSDDDYFDDLSNDLTATSHSHLRRDVELTTAWTGVHFSLLVQDFQTLNKHFTGLGGRFVKIPYKRLPQATLNLLTPTAPFQAGLDAQFTNFRRDQSVNAYRTDLRPRLVWGIDHGSWYVNSEAAYRLTYYDLNDLKYAGNAPFIRPDQHHITRRIPSFKAETGLRFSRQLQNGWIQTLEPRFQYLLVGYQDQSGIPAFDTGNATLNYDQLFADNRFTGRDRIGDANQITVGIKSRFIAPDTGHTMAEFDLGRVTSFRDQRVELPHSGAGTGYHKRGSDYVVGAMFSPNNFFTGRATVQYDPDHTDINRALAIATIGRSGGYQLDLSYRYDRDFRPARYITGSGDSAHTTLLRDQFETLSQAAVGFRAPISDQVDVLGRWSYSFEQDKNIETLAGLEYRPSCCYATRLAWRHYVAHKDGQHENAVMLQFVLRGLGRFGKSISSFVHRDVFNSASPP